ncbi:hypothetical protein CI109_101401 [Kwoniella shandongensis]|uniref:Uncharacterized protein n=1 Tax=Kwoniella shandongensis TaxID=1734106 RepID=A0A5M6BUI6_9TREE|nr:uncharacterized protein CI109_005098 [Kwoniella shandongensis]KAA5526524.1 hypothetical protein CI109_005098 [Kwoniella shandongensis]
MGFFDFLPCCGPRKEKVKDLESGHAETSTLLPPAVREESIISADGLTGGYGATTEQGLTEEQRTRIEAIGREVGNHMLPIHSLPPGQRSSPSLSKRSTSMVRAPSTSSQSSSRPPSPSPHRPETSPPDGSIQSPDRQRSQDEDDGVVRKQLFVGGGGGGARKTSGRGGRGKGRGKGRK